MVVVVFGPSLKKKDVWTSRQGLGLLEGASETGVTGQAGHRTMEMNGRSTVSYLVRTPRVPFLYARFNSSRGF